MTAAATATAAELAALIQQSPAAVGELTRRYGYTDAPTVEALAGLAQVRGAAFVDDLFIVLRQGRKAAPARYANLTGPGAAPAATAQRSKLAEGLKGILDAIQAGMGASAPAAPRPTPPAPGYDVEVGLDADTAPTPRILGLARPVFLAGCAVLALVLVVLLTRKAK